MTYGQKVKTHWKKYGQETNTQYVADGIQLKSLGGSTGVQLNVFTNDLPNYALRSLKLTVHLRGIFGSFLRS